MADWEATNALRRAHPIPIASAIPLAKVRLVINNRSIDKHPRRAILDASTAPAIRSIIMKRSNWTEHKMNLVAWDRLGSALKGYKQCSQTTLIKHCNVELPLGCRMNRRRGVEPTICKSCTAGCEETDDHMFQCSGHTQWETTTITSLKKFFGTTQTHRVIQDKILALLFPWRCAAPTGNFDRETLQVFNDLKTIGRMELWRGRIPVSLIQWHDQYTAENHSTTHVKGRTWAKQLITGLFNRVLTLWTHRNKLRHGETDEEARQILKEKLHERMAGLQDAVDSLTDPRDRALFLPKQRWSNLTNKQAEAYLSWAEDLAAAVAAEDTEGGDEVVEHTEEPGGEAPPEISGLEGQGTDDDRLAAALRPPPEPEPENLRKRTN